MYSADSPLVGKPTGTLADALSWLDIKAGAETEYATELFRLCTLVGLDPAILFAQAAHETGDFSSAWWQNRLNPAGLGITGDRDQDEKSFKFSRGMYSAQAHLGHMWVYVKGGRNPYGWFDPREQPALDAGYSNTVRTLADLTGRWAVDPRYAEKIAAKANAIFPQQEVQPTVTNELRIILNPGHRNSTGGNDEERQMTPALADAYFKAFTAAGYETVNLGDTNGGLDETCRRMAAQIKSAPGKCVLLDLHYEGSPAPGVFCIVPDVTGLTTGAPVPQDPLDTWDNNRDDTELGNAIAVKIAEATGLKLRTSGVRTPGLMDESQTGVGYEGFRLATFAYTSPYRTKAVRLVVEHGNHTIQPDRSIIMQPGFPQKCASAAVSAVQMVYGKTPAPAPERKPYPITWKAGDVGPQTLAGKPALAYLFELTAKKDATRRVGASSKEPTFGEKIKTGGKYVAIGGVDVSTPAGKLQPWVILDDLARVPMSVFVEKLPRP